MAVTFPLRLVESFDSGANLWRARRGDGEPVAETTCTVGDPAGADLGPGTAEDAALTARLAAGALADLARRCAADPALHRLPDAQVDLRLLRGHQLLADGDGRRLRLCCDTAGALGIKGTDDETARAFGLVGGNEGEAIRFVDVGGDFGQEFVNGDASGGGEVGGGVYFLLDLTSDRHC